MMDINQTVESAKALLALDESNSLVPIGVCGHARTIIESFIKLATQKEQAETVEYIPIYQVFLEAENWIDCTKEESDRYPDWVSRRTLYAQLTTAKPATNDLVDAECYRFIRPYLFTDDAGSVDIDILTLPNDDCLKLSGDSFDKAIIAAISERG